MYERFRAFLKRERPKDIKPEPEPWKQLLYLENNPRGEGYYQTRGEKKRTGAINLNTALLEAKFNVMTYSAARDQNMETIPLEQRINPKNTIPSRFVPLLPDGFNFDSVLIIVYRSNGNSDSPLELDQKLNAILQNHPLVQKITIE